MPAQMRGARLPRRAIAQQEDRAARLGGAEAEATAGLEVEQFLMTGNVSNDGRHGLAANGLFGGPEQFCHGRRPHQDDRGRIEPHA